VDARTRAAPRDTGTMAGGLDPTPQCLCPRAFCCGARCKWMPRTVPLRVRAQCAHHTRSRIRGIAASMATDGVARKRQCRTDYPACSIGPMDIPSRCDSLKLGAPFGSSQTQTLSERRGSFVALATDQYLDRKYCPVVLKFPGVIVELFEIRGAGRLVTSVPLYFVDPPPFHSCLMGIISL
jgi:hypothetical protein